MSVKKMSLVTIVLLSLLLVHITSQNNCVETANTYWTGYRCACKVGYKNQSNACIPLTLLKTKGWVVRQPIVLADDSDTTTNSKQNQTVVINLNCYLPFEYFNGQGCVCLEGYVRVNSLCQLSNQSNNTRPECPSNSNLINNQCVCILGYTKVNNVCIPSSNSGCGSNSYDNGLGFCVCATGYYKVNGTCVSGKPCPPLSSRKNNDECVCDAGLTKYGDYCSKCPLGAIYDSSSQKCVYVCGKNGAYNSVQQKCLCLNGYGIYQNACQICPAEYFIQQNYCVTCPVNSNYNSKTKRCECSNGYALNRFGVCMNTCGNNQIYNTITGNCDCVSGLGRINGVCQICPSSFALSANGNCIQCGLNQQLIDGKCVCFNGFIINELGICVSCSSKSGAFLINGQCAVCPGQLVYNGQKCACPAGKTRVGSRCQQTCKVDELIDENGLCYKCPIYEIISQGKCVCQKNYIRNSTSGQCELSCPNGQFKYQGRCAQCPLNLQYRSQIGGCACKDGEYLNTYGVCEKIILPPVTCRDGEYLDRNLGCVACTAGCKTCTSSSTCTSCIQQGFSVLNGLCQTICGDGLIAVGEQCDDRNFVNGDGCSSSCRIQPFFFCSGVPSVCTYNGPAICGNRRIEAGQTCDDGNLINGDGCNDKCQIQTPSNNNNPSSTGISLFGKVSTNMNNVYLTLKTNKTYKFVSENQMTNFIKTRFPDSSLVPSVYCSQREAPELDLFECLILYSSGIPNQKFKIQFSYNYQGQTGFLAVDVNPLSSGIPAKSRKV